MINELHLIAEKATLEIGAIIVDPRGMNNVIVNEVRLMDTQRVCHISIEQLFLQLGNGNGCGATSNECLIVNSEGVVLKTSQEEVFVMAQPVTNFGKSIADLVTSWMPKKTQTLMDKKLVA